MDSGDGFGPGAPFEVIEPDVQRLPFIFNSPHSGRAYPTAFLAASRLDERTIRRSEDSFVDELFFPAVALGAPLLRAHFPRAWLDVNREPFELDPRMFAGPLPDYANSRSLRVSSGLGTIARIVADNEEIYTGRLTVEEALHRIETVYMPYHRALAGLIERTRAAFGEAILIDCHSMPSSIRGAGGRNRPDFVVGDRFGTSSSAIYCDEAVAILVGLGYSVGRNKPYAGGFITEHYGRPAEGLHAIQLEINRGLYLDEQNLAKTAGFDRLARDIADFIGAFAGFAEAAFAARREAAE